MISHRLQEKDCKHFSNTNADDWFATCVFVSILSELGTQKKLNISKSIKMFGFSPLILLILAQGCVIVKAVNETTNVVSPSVVSDPAEKNKAAPDSETPEMHVISTEPTSTSTDDGNGVCCFELFGEKSLTAIEERLCTS